MYFVSTFGSSLRKYVRLITFEYLYTTQYKTAQNGAILASLAARHIAASRYSLPLY